MSEEDFMQSLLSEGEGLHNSVQSRLSELVKKLNLPSRYTILIDNPIEQFSTAAARAFEVNDQKQKDNIFAKILNGNLPVMFETIQLLKNYHNNHFTNIIDSGLTDAGGGNFGSFAVILEKPKGIKLTSYIKKMAAERKADANYSQSKEISSAIGEEVIVEEIVQPINEMLKSFAELKISHGLINSENIYFNEMGEYRFTLVDQISEPGGFSQPLQYETISRAHALPLGKGAASIKDDYFALGVLVYHCIFGEMPGHNLQQNEIIKGRIMKGTYNFYIGNAELSPRLTDILRGLLTDNQNERWGYEQVNQWVKGKRFNLIRPSVRKEASRGYEFADIMHPNKKSLALSYNENWDTAASDIRERKIIKWLELSAADKDTAEDIANIISTTGGDKSRSRQDNEELISKTLIVLDEDAPIRVRNLSIHVDGFGIMLANAWQQHNQNDLQLLLEILRMNLLDYKAARMAEGSKLDRWTLQRQSNYIKFKSYGFGVERVLYDLNPTLPCQSQMLSGQFIIDASQLLYFMNDNAARLTSHDPVDRHIAAFLASKLELASEIKLKIISRFRKNEAVSNLIIKLALLAFAQKKTKVSKLSGLSVWLAEKLKIIIATIHSKDLRKELQEEIKSVSAQGSLEALITLITTTNIFAKDDEGFAEAKASYSLLDAEMKAIKARDKVFMGHDVFYLYGLQFCKVIAAVLFIITLGLTAL